MQTSATLIHNLKAHTDEVARLLFSPDGNTLAACDDLVISLWDINTGTLRSKSENLHEMYFEMAFSPDSRWIAAASEEGHGRIWNTQTGELEHTVSVEDERMLSLAFSADSKSLATGSEEVRVWDVVTGDLQHTLLDPGRHPLSFTAVYERGEYPAEVITVSFSPDGKFLVSGWPSTSTVCVWNMNSWTLEHTFSGYTADFSTDSGKLAVPTNSYKTIQIHETATWQLLNTLGNGDQRFSSSTFSSDSAFIATHSGREIKLWDVNTGEVAKIFTDPTTKVSALAFSPDGRVLISGTKKCGLRIWDVENGDCLLVLESEDGTRDIWNKDWTRGDPPAFEVLFGDSGGKVAVAFPDGSVRVWDLKWE